MSAQRGFALIPVVIVGVIVSALALFSFKYSTSTNSSVSPGTNHYKGSPKAKVTVEELVDYQCKACADYNKINKEIIKKYGASIVFYVRHFPIETHKNAFSAAEAAEAAGAQGKFWEMHDLLLQNQREWEETESPLNFYITYARQLGLNTEEFKKAIENNTYKERIQQDKRYGESLKADAIPSVIINGKNEGYLNDAVLLSGKIDTAMKQDVVDRRGLPLTTILGMIWDKLTGKTKKREPVCVSVCKEGDCLCEVADIVVTVHGEKPKEREELNQTLDTLRKLKYAPAAGGLSFLGKKLLDRAIDEIQNLAREAEKISRKLTGVDVYVTVASFPCNGVACGSSTQWTWGDGKTKQIMIPPPKDCINTYVPSAWDEKCLLDKKGDFEPYITREAKKSCPSCK